MNMVNEPKIIPLYRIDGRCGVDLCALVAIIFNIFVTLAFYSNVMFK